MTVPSTIMVVPPLPADEKERLERLRRLGLLDTAPDALLDDVVHIAAVTAGTPIALVSLVDAERQWFKARFGIDACETSREVSFCAHAIQEGRDCFVVEDAHDDPRFADNPLVLGPPHVRFYMGFPLLGGDGRSAIGTLCVADRVARTLDESRVAALRALARMVEARVTALGEISVLVRTLEQLRATEAQLSAARDAAEAAVRAKAAFLATMSHEIRTPMNGVIGMTELLLGTPLSAQQRDYVETVRSCGDALLSVLNDVLDFSRIEAGKLQLEQVAFDPRDVIASVNDILTPMAKGKGLRLTADVGRVTKRVLGDPLRLRQVLVNLVGNAVKFTESGEVTVEAKMAPAADGGVRLTVRVRDTGIGIPAAALGRIFEAFSQADPSMTRKFGGTGLGLAITRQLVSLMGGDIAVESEVGRGSCFQVKLTLPAAVTAETPSDAPPPSTRAAAPEGDVVRGRALVVEDNEVNARIAGAMLERFGFRVERAGDGEEALRKLDDAAFDIVWMDCQMPKMDGYAAVRELRSRERPPKRSYVVALTAHAGDGARDACVAAGMDDYVPKPLRMSDLEAAILRWRAARA